MLKKEKGILKKYVPPFPLMKMFFMSFSTIVLSTSFFISHAFSRSPEEYCPAEKYDSVTVQGKYVGWQLPNTPKKTITVRLKESHVPLYIIASEFRAKSLFGNNYNKNVEVTYDYVQNYSKKDRKCIQYYVLKNGKVLAE